jgi:hypothetical protein
LDCGLWPTKDQELNQAYTHFHTEPPTSLQPKKNPVIISLVTPWRTLNQHPTTFYCRFVR